MKTMHPEPGKSSLRAFCQHPLNITTMEVRMKNQNRRIRGDIPSGIEPE